MQEMEWNLSTVVILVVVLALVAFAVYRAYLSWTGKDGCHGGGSCSRTKTPRKRAAEGDSSCASNTVSQTDGAAARGSEHCERSVDK